MENRNNLKNINIQKPDFELNTFSAYDCTGLIPYALQSDEEIEAYNEMYHFMPQNLSDTDK